MSLRRIVVKSRNSNLDVDLTADGKGRLMVAADKLAPGIDFDYIDVQQTSSSVETYVYKLGGSGGAVVRTVVVTYTSPDKTDINHVSFE